jgi:2'-5' RNA ligase
MRLFIAIPLPQSIKDNIVKIQENLRPGLGNAVRWTNSDSIHLTLKFLGETTPAKIPGIESQVIDVCDEFKQFSMQCSRIGTFPNPQQPNIIWLGLEAPPILAKLQKDLEISMHTLGFEEEKRNFSPHLTIGRLSAALDFEQKAFLKKMMNIYDDQMIASFIVEEIYLMKSDLRPSGPIYTVQKKFFLKKE